MNEFIVMYDIMYDKLYVAEINFGENGESTIVLKDDRALARSFYGDNWLNFWENVSHSQIIETPHSKFTKYDGLMLDFSRVMKLSRGCCPHLDDVLAVTVEFLTDIYKEDPEEIDYSRPEAALALAELLKAQIGPPNRRDKQDD